jgi:hypothetical protein
MRRVLFTAFTALLVVPAFALADTTPSPADQSAAVQQCTAQRSPSGMGLAAFKLLYGTNANRSNAFGKCVSKLAQQNAHNQTNAAAQCRTERSADPSAFKKKYGTGHNGSNAFGNCVSTKAKAAAAAQQQATDNAAKLCFAERKLDPAAFKAKYGTNHNKSNAFGKCVSSKVK